MLRSTVLSIAAAALVAAHASPRATQPAECPEATVSAIADSLPDLSGVYRLTMVGTRGYADHRSARGLLSLAARPRPQLGRVFLGGKIDLAQGQPFFGTSTIPLDSVGAATEGSLSSTDPFAPGAVIRVSREGGHLTDVELGLGSTRNDARVFMNDGAVTIMRIERIGPRGFTGRWRSSVGYSTHHAGGYFCAVKVGTPVPALTDPSDSHVQAG